MTIPGTIEFFRKLLIATASFLLGVGIGYLIWEAYFKLGLPEWVTTLIINRTNGQALANLIDTARGAEYLMLLALFLVQSFAGGVGLGIVTGLIVWKASYKRTIAYAVMVWPTWFLLMAYINIQLLILRASPIVISEERERLAMYALNHFAMYSIFYLAMYGTLKLVQRRAERGGGGISKNAFRR